MFPPVFVCYFLIQISNRIYVELRAIIVSKEIFPTFVISIIPIKDGVYRLDRGKIPGRVGIFFFAEDIAAIIIGVDPGLTRNRIILTHQLIKRIILIGDSLCCDAPIGNRGDISAIIIGVGVNIRSCACCNSPCFYLQ